MRGAGNPSSRHMSIAGKKTGAAEAKGVKLFRSAEMQPYLKVTAEDLFVDRIR